MQYRPVKHEEYWWLLWSWSIVCAMYKAFVSHTKITWVSWVIFWVGYFVIAVSYAIYDNIRRKPC